VALYNEILVGRFNKSLSKLFSMKGAAAAPQLASEIVPAHTFFSGAENRFLESWDRFSFQLNVVAGGAGNRSGIKARNPAGSNVIAIFEKVTFNGVLADQPFINQERNITTDFATAIAATNFTSLDARSQRRNSTIIVTQQTNAPVVGNNVWQGAYPASGMADVIIDENQEIPLLPGDSYVFYANTLNQVLAVSFFWRERILEESELK
jgi:hypothetical protein